MVWFASQRTSFSATDFDESVVVSKGLARIASVKVPASETGWDGLGLPTCPSEMKDSELTVTNAPQIRHRKIATRFVADANFSFRFCIR